MAGLDNMKQRLAFSGGNRDGLLVKGKLNSLNLSLQNSYQAEWITFNKKRHRCLINPDKMSTDYDQKLISIDFGAGMKPGDTFYWDRTKHWWIVYNRRVEEEAYFRANIRRCDYKIATDENEYWVYLRGPVETAIDWNQKHSIAFNDLNYSLELFIQKNEDTKEFFTRHKIVKFDGHNWKVAATDKYSQEGIIEVYLQEHFDNEELDNMVVPEIVEPDKTEPYIEGPQKVKPYDSNISYSIVNDNDGEFVVSSSKVKIIESSKSSCSIDIITGKSATFDLKYIKEDEEVASLTVTIESF